MATIIRPLDPADVTALSALEGPYAVRHRVPAIVTKASLTFFLRTGHAFAAETEGHLQGFVLAQAVWNGEAPAVWVTRLVTGGQEPRKLASLLLEAVTKSGYDAAVYKLMVFHPPTDEVLRSALEALDYNPAGLDLYQRRLGSGASAGTP